MSDERIVELYNESACAVVPSLYEGFSLPAIEAMSTGCRWSPPPVVPCPRWPAPMGETCYAVEPGDSFDLARGILAVLDDPAAAGDIGRAGRERVIARWSWRHTAEQTVEHYRATLELPPASKLSAR